MPSIIHHIVGAPAGETSPFILRIHAIAKGSTLRIACPYIGLRVLRPIVERSKTWRLLTDTEELLRNQPTSQCAEWVAFFEKHPEKIRHCRGLHAKVVLGDSSALVGSANLTEAGLGKRHEMAVYSEEATMVGPLTEWFDSLWNQCPSVPARALHEFVRSLPLSLQEAEPIRLDLQSPQVSAKVHIAAFSTQGRSKVGRPCPGNSRLPERLAHAISRAWIDGYLDLCSDLLRSLPIEESDKRLVMAIPKEHRLPITINQRYVLSAFLRGKQVIGLMLPPEVKIPASLESKIIHSGRFKAWADETPKMVPRFDYFKIDDPKELKILREAWLRAVAQESKRAWKCSSYRDFHASEFHRVVVDLDYRRQILDHLAFR